MRQLELYFELQARKNKPLNIIISVDNSGSMLDESSLKLLYIIQKMNYKNNKITLIKHTDEINDILKNEKDDKKILDFLGKREAGGTSHRDVFEYLENNISKDMINNTVFVSFSDNYSDIEIEYFNFNIIQQVPKFWLNYEGRSVDDCVNGMKIQTLWQDEIA